MSRGRDMALVAPERRPEVNRRIDIIERFIRQPGRTAAEQCAVDLGISTGQFYTLVKAWRTSGRPESIAGSGRPRVRPSSITMAQAAIIEEAANAHDRPQSSLRHALDLANARGVTMPHVSAMRRHYERIRPRRLPDAFTAAGDALVLDACAVGIAVRDPNVGAGRPVMTAVIDVRRTRLIGISLSTAGFDSVTAAAALLDAMKATASVGTAPVDTYPSLGRWDVDASGWDEFDRSLMAAGIGVSNLAVGGTDRSRGVTGILGTRNAGIKFLPRLTLSDASRRIATTQDGEQMDLDMALDLLRGRFLEPARFSALDALSASGRWTLVKAMERLTKSE